MLLTPSQSKIALCLKRFRVVNCGRRFGKTTLAVLEMIGKAISKDDVRIAYIAPTYQQARDIAWEDLKSIAKPATLKVNESRLEIQIKSQFGGMSRIMLRGWESIETLRGQKFDFIVIDEIASMRNFWVNWEEVIRPTLTDRKGEVLFISTPKGFNHFYDLYNKSLGDEDFESFHFTTYDNPHLPIEEIDKAKKEMLPDRFSQEYLADFKKSEGLVYKEFNRERHIFTDLNLIKATTDYIAGLDFGYSNPCAIVAIKKDYEDIYWVTNNWYKRGQTEEMIGDYVAGCKFNKVYPDPESPSGIAVLKAKGVNVREVIKNKDSIKSGIDKVRELFLNNKLRIHSSCVELIEELETYSYPEKKDMQNEQENPIKENDHALDALRYALSMHSASQQRLQAKQFIPKFT